MSKHIVLLLALGAIPASALAAVEGSPQPTKPRAEPKIEPEADRSLKEMADYLASLKQFRFQNFKVDEVVTTKGQKIQIVGDSMVSVKRPNQLRSEELGKTGLLSYLYDGKTMTLACKSDNSYATVPAPATLDATIDMTRQKYHIEAPGADLLFSRPYDVLTEQVTGGQVIGSESIDGEAVKHLAFTGEEVDWQIWIKEGKEPLPVRFVITTKTMKEQPQFTAQLSNWEPHAKLPESTFTFKPPADAKRLEALPTSCGKP